MSLVEFLLARIAEDEEDARDAYYEGQRWIPEEEAVVAADQDYDSILFLDRKRDARHAANWSPARVLAECEAKRRIVAIHAGDHECATIEDGYAGVFAADGTMPLICPTMTAFASVYAGHPDYDEAWRP